MPFPLVLPAGLAAAKTAGAWGLTGLTGLGILSMFMGEDDDQGDFDQFADLLEQSRESAIQMPDTNWRSQLDKDFTGRVAEMGFENNPAKSLEALITGHERQLTKASTPYRPSPEIIMAKLAAQNGWDV